MSSVSTFGAFTTARLGIYAAQKGLDVTGNNITNINTTGYTRQRLEQISLRTGTVDRYQSIYDTRVGSGVLTTGVSQLRDPYLDIRYRNEQSSVGSMDAKLSGLEELSSVLDEVYDGTDHDGIIEARFNDLVTQLQNLADNTGQDEFDTLVRSSADSLVKLFNSYSEKLQTIKDTQAEGFSQDVDTVNDILKSIRELNNSIQKSEIHGDSALEMKDQRNLLLDQLSQYVKIDVTYTPVDLGGGATVDKLVVSTVGDTSYTLVDGNYAGDLSISTGYVKNPSYDSSDPASEQYLKPDGTTTNDTDEAQTVEYGLVLSQLENAKGEALSDPQNVVKTIGDTDLYGSLQATREMLTEAGEFTSVATQSIDSDATTKRGIPYYQNALDALAQKFASVFNEANNGYLADSDGNYVDSAGVALTYTDPVTSNTVTLTKSMTLTSDQANYLESNGVALGGNLLSNSSDSDDDSGITAANISISNSWSLGNVRIVNSFIMGNNTVDENGVVTPSSTDSTNISHLIVLMDGDQNYYAGDISEGAVNGSTAFFKGSFQEMLANITSTLANDQKSTTTLVNNYLSASDEIATSRDSVSGVDLNDEATSLMQYQKSYAAACRLMTTLDEALDKLINGTGVVGR